MAKKRQKQQKPARPLTPRDEAFLLEIVAHPGEDAPRLVYADWLDEQSDSERAELIRVQIELARLEKDDATRAKLAIREGELLAAHAEAWLEPIPRYLRVKPPRFERGFPSTIDCDLDEFLANAEALWKSAPVTSLRLRDTMGMSGDVPEDVDGYLTSQLKQMATLPQMAHVRSLSLYGCGLRGKHIKPLLASPHVSNLRFLDLGANSLGDAGARMISELSHLSSLGSLLLPYNNIGDKGAIALANSPHLDGLAVLVLAHNRIGAEGEAALQKRFGQRVQLQE